VWLIGLKNFRSARSSSGKAKASGSELKLSLDGGLIYDRPYSINLFTAKLIEHVFGKGDSLPVHIQAKEPSLWRTVEA
jgi:hypothetical protein